MGPNSFIHTPSSMNENAARFVIVIPTKNRCTLLARALESVRSQSYTNYRIIVVNDGSTDGTQRYLDSLHDARIQTIHHSKNRGVNAARNAAFRMLREGEWALPLDDDDMLLPEALQHIARQIEKLPDFISVACFNTTIRTHEKEYKGGRNFEEGEESYDPSYHALMTGEGLKTEGDNRAVLKWTLFPKYLFSEDVNGFEGEWWLLIGRDGVGVRYFPEEIILIDQTHGGEHLSRVAARRNPSSFIRAHRRIFHDHKEFFSKHPDRRAARAVVVLKLSIRAADPIAFVKFAGHYLHASYRSLISRPHK